MAEYIFYFGRLHQIYVEILMFFRRYSKTYKINRHLNRSDFVEVLNYPRFFSKKCYTGNDYNDSDTTFAAFAFNRESLCRN